MNAIIKRMEGAVKDDLFIPMYSKAQLESKNFLSLAFLQRQFWQAYKLLVNTMHWHWMVSRKKLQELAIKGIMNRYLCMALPFYPDTFYALECAKKVVGVLPKEWLEKSDEVVDGMESFAFMLQQLAKEVIKTSLNTSSDIEKKKTKILIQKTISILMHIQAFDVARSVAQALKGERDATKFNNTFAAERGELPT